MFFSFADFLFRQIKIYVLHFKPEHDFSTEKATFADTLITTE